MKFFIPLFLFSSSVVLADPLYRCLKSCQAEYDKCAVRFFDPSSNCGPQYNKCTLDCHGVDDIPGNWQKSCYPTSINQDGRILAMCKNDNGDWVKTTINYEQECHNQGGLNNQNGQLHCAA